MRIWFLRRFPTALITLLLAVGLATSAVSQARTPDASGAEPPSRALGMAFANSIIAFGLFGPESVFASEAEEGRANPAGAAPARRSAAGSLQQ